MPAYHEACLSGACQDWRAWPAPGAPVNQGGDTTGTQHHVRPDSQGSSPSWQLPGQRQAHHTEHHRHPESRTRSLGGRWCRSWALRWILAGRVLWRWGPRALAGRPPAGRRPSLWLRRRRLVLAGRRPSAWQGPAPAPERQYCEEHDPDHGADREQDEERDGHDRGDTARRRVVQTGGTWAIPVGQLLAGVCAFAAGLHAPEPGHTDLV